MAKKIPVEELEGAISVDGDVTPITRQRIQSVTANEWHEMTMNQLHSQREVLVNRYYAALSAGMLQGAQTIQMGIMTIDAKLDELSDSLGADGLGFM